MKKPFTRNQPNSQMTMKHMRRWLRLLILMVMATLVRESPTFSKASHIRSGRKASPIILIVCGSGGSNEWSWNYPLLLYLEKNIRKYEKRIGFIEIQKPKMQKRNGH